MNSGDFSNVPNPFAFAAQSQARAASHNGPRRRAVISALKFLLLVAICFALVLGISIGSKQYLLHRLTAGFDSIGSAEQQERLVQMAQLGPSSIAPLTEALLSSDIDVARTAYDLLRKQQNEWMILSPGEQRVRHSQLIAAVRGIAVQLPDDRTGWAASLVQQTISEIVQRTDGPTRSLYHDANKTLEMLTLSTRSGPSIVSDQPLDPISPQRLVVRGSPLPVDVTGADRWAVDDEVNASNSELPSPSIYKSAASRLQPVAPEQQIVLRDINATVQTIAKPAIEPRETSYQIDQVQSTSPLVDSAMQAYDDPSVLLWLSSEHANLRQQAKLELMSRGYSERELALAARIAASDVPTRVELVDQIAREPSIDPRPWLWMMSRDEHRDVRLQVVSVIATMNDPEARRHLESRRLEETDPVVSARIRRVLEMQ